MESDVSFEQPRPISVRSITPLLEMLSDISFGQPRPISLRSVTLQPEIFSDVSFGIAPKPVSLL